LCETSTAVQSSSFAQIISSTANQNKILSGIITINFYAGPFGKPLGISIAIDLIKNGQTFTDVRHGNKSWTEYQYLNNPS